MGESLANESIENRDYDYTDRVDRDREEYPLIAEMIDPGLSVVDFGCGNGRLLELLGQSRGCTGRGFDVSESGVALARKRGVDAHVRRIDQKHGDLQDGQFDVAICSATLQMIMYPEILLKEMARVSRHQIISFPNFAHYRNRLDMFLRGRMPRPLLFGYEWYSTGNIHQLSLDDFQATVGKLGLQVVARRFLPSPPSPWKRAVIESRPNLFAVMAVFKLRSGSQ